MNTEQLQAAKNHEKNRAYDKAINAYEQYMKHHHGPFEAEIYTSYGKALRLAGKTARAKEALREGSNEHPSSEEILMELCTLYEISGDWNSAKFYADTLIDMNPEQSNHHIRLGRIHSHRKEYHQAEEAYKSALMFHHGLEFDRLIEKIQQGFAENPADVTTRYVTIGGMNNLGAFIHEYGNKTFLTKIAKYKGTNKREAFFYKELCSDFPVLKELVPSFIDSQVMDNILYLTIEKIAGDPPPSKVDHFEQVRDIAQKMASIKYTDVAGKFNIPNYQFQFNLRNPNIVAQFFTQIHKKKYNQKLFESLHLLINQNEYPETIYHMVHRLEDIVMKNQLYDLIEPEKLYTLMHGEFKPESLIIARESGTPYVIDWSTFTIGLNVVEMARYLSASLPSFITVEQVYLHKETNLTHIERIFFLYAIILFYLLRWLKSTKTESRKKISDFIQSALDAMEQAIESNYFTDVRKVKQLEEKIDALERDKKELRKELNNVLHSRSWKITAPLRKLTERLKR